VTIRLLDIEGTVCPISFVKDTLFPYARARLGAFVTANAHDPGVQADLAAAAALGSLDVADREGIVALLLRWIDEDRKATPLKSLQGRIWQEARSSPRSTLTSPRR
jgi:enolase-phosphatase E1